MIDHHGNGRIDRVADSDTVGALGSAHGPRITRGSARPCRIGVIGAGYVGLVTGACFAHLGYRVVCIETDPWRLAMLHRGELPIHEPGLDELVARGRRAGRLDFTSDYVVGLNLADVAFIAVPTPPRPDGQADTSFVLSAVRSALEHAPQGLILVTKSTVPVGTADAITELARRSGRGDVHVVSNPEFLREGSAIRDFLHPDRVVVGASDPEAASVVAGLYESLEAPVITCDWRSSELAKYTANALLATRISFINEISALCEAVGADIEEVGRIVGSDRRIGPDYLGAGLGWGGSCFPKDLRALDAMAAEHGCPAPILRGVREVNERQRGKALALLLAAVRTREEPTVGVLGLAFKPGTDDVRGAPALDVIAGLLGEGVAVHAHDPVASANARREVPDACYCVDPYEVAKGCHALLLATDWAEYLGLDWGRVRSLMRGDTVVDGRNVLDGSILNQLGFRYISFGRSSSPELSRTEDRYAAFSGSA
ncbi:MAG: UDP-glucose/GDP-mannose dehydrogenase family protein [Chloroflexota bacterium]|nr:UDP-glucose/GDP-mannose dehydrogenase family protein [Chloroflexota bacterium]